MPKAKVPTHAAMFKITSGSKPTYYVQATDRSVVRGFESMRQGLDYFEVAYRNANQRGGGFVAGAILNYIALQPKVFRFDTLDKLVELLGEVVTAYSLNGTGVFETGFKCVDQKAAAKVYEKATEPRLAG